MHCTTQFTQIDLNSINTSTVTWNFLNWKTNKTETVRFFLFIQFLIQAISTLLCSFRNLIYGKEFLFTIIKFLNFFFHFLRWDSHASPFAIISSLIKAIECIELTINFVFIRNLQNQSESIISSLIFFCLKITINTSFVSIGTF